MLPIMSNSTLGSIYMTNLSGNLLSFVLFQLPNLILVDPALPAFIR
jgi:hypothetical protein